MQNEETREIEVVRLEERTKALEKCDRRHYVIEIILFISFILLTLVVVSSCDIMTPERIENREWVYTEVKDCSGLEFSVNEDGESVTAVSGSDRVVIAKNDVKNFSTLRLTLKIETVSEERINILRADDNSIVGYFEFR